MATCETLPAADDVTDWCDYIEWAQNRLGLSGSGQRSGTILLTDRYPLTRELVLDSHVTIEGSVRAKHHSGSSHGFYVTDDFEGDTVLSWRKPKANKNYSNFGAGIHQIHVESKEGVNGVSFRGAQQSCRVDNLVVRGFGAATGLSLHGDTYTVRDCFVDAIKGGGLSVAVAGATAFKFPEQVYSLALNNITSHNCEVGLEASDLHQVGITNFETETTNQPLRFTYNVIGVNISNCAFRHTREILEITKARWPQEYLVKLNGMTADGRGGTIRYPDGQTWSSPRKVFDLVIEGNNSGLFVTDLKEQRSQA